MCNEVTAIIAAPATVEAFKSNDLPALDRIMKKISAVNSNWKSVSYWCTLKDLHLFDTTRLTMKDFGN
jgi:hypothetical protein